MKESIILRIKPRPTPRPKFNSYTKTAYNPTWYTNYKKELIVLILQQKRLIPKKDYHEIHVRFGVPYPKQVKGGKKMKIEGLPNVEGNGDVDNYIKGIKDALEQAGVFTNDCQVYFDCAAKVNTCTNGYIEFILF